MFRPKHPLLRLLLALSIFLQLLPASAQDAALTLQDYLRRGESLHTLQPPLSHNGKRYEIHYFTTGDYDQTRSQFIYVASPTSFESHEITGMLVTADGKIVSGESDIREVLLLYRAAFYLYEQATLGPMGFTDFYPFDEFRSDLRLVIGNPLFGGLQVLPVPGLSDSPRERALEALRAILTAQYSPPEEIEAFGNNLRQLLEDGEGLEGSVDLALETARLSNNKALRTVSQDIRQVFKSWRPVTDQLDSYVQLKGRRIELSNALDVLQLGVNLMWIADLQQDRADWLESYLTTFTASGVRLEGPVNEAAWSVIAEAEDSWVQRGDIVLDWIGDEGVDWTLNLGQQVMLRQWTKWAWQTYGKRIAGHEVASAASGILLAFTLADFLYGFEDLYSNFVVAETSDDLRQAFWQGRLQIQELASESPSSVYDGDLARQFQVAYMLESLAAAQAMRSYADGIEATVDRGVLSVLSPISWWNWVIGDEWGRSARGMREIANSVELEAENAVGHPEFIDRAAELAMDRLGLIGAADHCLVKNDDGIEFHEAGFETSPLYVACVDLTDPYIRFEMVMANDTTNVNATPDQRETIASTVRRGPYASHNPLLAFNADYFGAGHGPEGFAVKNGFRLDGSFSQDNDGNATARVSQSVGRDNAVTIGFRSAEDISDPLLLATRFYNATGGGPTLLKNGAVIADPCPPEGFSNSDECRRTSQTAVGVSEDGRTYIVIAAENKTGAEMGQLLLAYGAYSGMKLDGGGSTQLWYDGKMRIESSRGIANTMLVFREETPRHDAFLLQKSRFPVVEPGTPITLTFTLRNTGFLTWEPGLPYAIRNTDGNPLGLVVDQQLPSPVITNADVEWALPIRAPAQPGFYSTRWQMAYAGKNGEELFGDEVGFVITVAPQGTPPDIMGALQNLVANVQDQIRSQIDQFVAELERQIVVQIVEAIRRAIPPELQCLSPISVFLMVGIALVRRRGQH